MVFSLSADDAVDLELGVILPMALMLLVVLAPPHLENRHLVGATVRDDNRLDRRTGNGRLTQTDAVAFADHQYLIEHAFPAPVRRYLFYLEFFAGGNLVLLAAGFYDRVHGRTPLICFGLPRTVARAGTGKALKYNVFMVALSKLR